MAVYHDTVPPVEIIEVPTPRAYIDRSNETLVEWGTPDDLYENYNRVFGPFTLDPAANCGRHMTIHNVLPIPSNGTLKRFFCLGCGDDGLELPWYGRVFLNPPYDKTLSQWVQKAIDEIATGNVDLVAMLLPVRTGRLWWGNLEFVTSATGKIIYLRKGVGGASSGRLKFKGADNSAPFDSCVALLWNL